ncbi:response regulator [Brevibacterium album]|uniref:response regulator n=1 Tax=Brevibacterium album TaxID=417948 RepID=UPI0004017A1F|nr:response regulator [Brevibacterium album]
MVQANRSGSDETASLGVLVVEDETIAAKAHANYIERMDGFRLIGFAKNAQHALAALTGRIVGIDAREIDLVLLDMNLPDGHGIQLLRTLRAHQIGVDVIAVTAARDMQVVQDALSLGVAHYILKPFTFPVFRSKLEAFAAYRRQVDDQCGPAKGAITQSQIDAAVAGMRAGTGPQRAKGVPEVVQDQIIALLTDEGLSAAEAADRIGVSRVTARRYLEAMADVGLLDRQPRYGSAGRPVLEYVTVR